MFNKKNLLTMFAGIALLSATGMSSVNAFADESPDSHNEVGHIDNNGTASLGQLSDGHDGNSKADNSNQGKGTVSGNSDAHIRVEQGYLTLEQVPSLGFQSVGAKDAGRHAQKSDQVTDNNNVLKNDTFYGHQPVDPQELYVQDNRTSNSTNSTNGGYNVTVSLGNFGNYDGSGNLSNLNSNNNNWTMKLNGMADSSVDNQGTSISQGVILTSNGTDSKTVLNNNQVGSGGSKVNFNSGDSTGDKTSLIVPQGIPAGQYAATMTWTLSPVSAASGQDSGGNSSGGTGTPTGR